MGLCPLGFPRCCSTGVTGVPAHPCFSARIPGEQDHGLGSGTAASHSSGAQVKHRSCFEMSLSQSWQDPGVSPSAARALPGGAPAAQGGIVVSRGTLGAKADVVPRAWSILGAGLVWGCPLCEHSAGLCVSCPQVSHHPPAAAHHVYSRRGWTLWQEITIASKFRGKYLSIMPLGR